MFVSLLFLYLFRLLAPRGQDLCVHNTSLCGTEERWGESGKIPLLLRLLVWAHFLGWSSGLWAGLFPFFLFFFFLNLLLFTLRCCWVVFEFPWNSSCYWAVFILLMAQLSRRKCRFLWFFCPWRIIKNEQFLNASIVTYSGMLLSHIFGRVLNVSPEERVHITGE